ncbi:MAG: serine hydroxymethyltransferase [Planctomycetes bacterium]|nr:serine hydroxymethyltransferase [Planctomycetota bacterium]
MKDKVKRILDVIEKQNEWRGRQTINLIASENQVSDIVKFALQSDFCNRYAEGHPGARYYNGTQYVDIIETFVEEEFKRHLSAKHVEVRSISGTMSNDVVFRSLLTQDDGVLVYKVGAGGHISHQGFGSVGKYTSKIKNIPLASDNYSVDIETTRKLIIKEKPRLVILGRSMILFPEPIKELSQVAEKTGTIIMFDASHVFGLVMAGLLNKPFAEGVHIVTASTHKTFWGTQRGIIATNDQELYKKLERACFPGAVSNHHLNTLAGLAIALCEFEDFGIDYATQVVKNAKKLAEELDAKSLKVLFKEHDYTETHQVVIDVSSIGPANELANKLEQNNIIVNANMLPTDKNVRVQNGIRIGVQEITRLGMKEADMTTIADFLSTVLLSKKNIKSDVVRFKEGFSELKFTYKNISSALQKISV